MRLCVPAPGREKRASTPRRATNPRTGGRPARRTAGTNPKNWTGRRFFFNTVGDHVFTLDFGGCVSEVVCGVGMMVWGLGIRVLSAVGMIYRVLIFLCCDSLRPVGGHSIVNAPLGKRAVSPCERYPAQRPRHKTTYTRTRDETAAHAHATACGDSFIHSFIQKLHSSTRGTRTHSDARVTTHARCTANHFSQVVRSARAPFLLRLLLCFSAPSLSLSSLTSPRTVTCASFSSVACGGLHAHVRRNGPAGRSSRR